MFVVDRRGIYVTHTGRDATGVGCRVYEGSNLIAREARKLEKGKRTTNERQKNDRHPKTSNHGQDGCPFGRARQIFASDLHDGRIWPQK